MAKVVVREGNIFTLQITVTLTDSLMKNNIMDECNKLGSLAKEEALTNFDTDGSPIKWGEIKMSVREKDSKTFQT